MKKEEPNQLPEKPIEVMGKMLMAKESIKKTAIKKEGRNEFSKYDYFTPSQIEQLVSDICSELKLMTKFDLKRNELGVTGFLSVVDIESQTTLTYEMATAIPEIKATNIVQQMGGCVTYTERYLKMSAFGITDNNLDFDTDKKNDPKADVKQENKFPEDNRPWMTDKQYVEAMERIRAGDTECYEKAMKAFRMKKEFREKLNALIK